MRGPFEQMASFAERLSTMSTEDALREIKRKTVHLCLIGVALAASVAGMVVPNRPLNVASLALFVGAMWGLLNFEPVRRGP